MSKKSSAPPTLDYSVYRVHLTRYMIDEVLHYTHWIPVLRGRTTEYFDKNYPGWDLPTFIRIFDAAEVRLDDGIGAPHGGRCHWRLKCLHFNDVDSFAVEWDQTVTVDDGRFFWSGDPSATGDGAFTAEVESNDVNDPKRRDALAHELVGRLGSTSKKS